MPATVQGQFFGGASSLPAGTNAEGGATFNRADSLAGTTPIPIPTSAGVNFSYLKAFGLAVTGTSSTTMSNRTLRISAGLSTGLGLHWKIVAQASWAASLDQTGASKAPTDTSGSNNASSAPGGYTAVTTTATQWDNTSQVTSSTGIGTVPLLATLLAVDATFVGGGGSSSLGTLVLGFDEA